MLLLRHLIRAPEAVRLLVIGTYRDTDLDRSHPLSEILADLRREPVVSRLALSGLDVAGLGELLARSADERMDLRAEELAQVLWDETEGNPFFVQEVLRSLVESGRLVQRDGVWTTDLEIAELGIPEGIRDVVGRRLSRLSEEANAALTLASVIGAVIDVDVLVAVSGSDEDHVLDALDEATAASLLKETASGAYEFTHALVRSTLYEELSATRRGRRHRQVAEAMERQGNREASSLAYHFRRAATPDVRAVDYAEAAGEQALERLAFDQAVDFFGQALESAEDVEAPARRRCALMIREGTAQRLAAIPAYRRLFSRRRTSPARRAMPNIWPRLRWPTAAGSGASWARWTRNGSRCSRRHWRPWGRRTPRLGPACWLCWPRSSTGATRSSVASSSSTRRLPWPAGSATTPACSRCGLRSIWPAGRQSGRQRSLPIATSSSSWPSEWVTCNCSFSPRAGPCSTRSR